MDDLVHGIAELLAMLGRGDADLGQRARVATRETGDTPAFCNFALFLGPDSVVVSYTRNIGMPLANCSAVAARIL